MMADTFDLHGPSGSGRRGRPAGPRRITIHRGPDGAAARRTNRPPWAWHRRAEPGPGNPHRPDGQPDRASRSIVEHLLDAAEAATQRLGDSGQALVDQNAEELRRSLRQRGVTVDPATLAGYTLGVVDLAFQLLNSGEQPTITDFADLRTTLLGAAARLAHPMASADELAELTVSLTGDHRLAACAAGRCEACPGAELGCAHACHQPAGGPPTSPQGGAW